MENISQKFCTGCNKNHPISDFYKNRGHKDGLSSRCKECIDKHNKKWAITNANKVREYLARWRAENKTRTAELNKKYKTKHPELVKKSAKKYSEKHADRISEYGKKHYQENKQRKLEVCRKYRSEHPEKESEFGRNRRARKIANGGVITAKEWQEVLDKYGHKCLRCGRHDVKLSMDHVVPLKLGGKHAKENVQPLCIPCNSWKNARIIDFRPF